MSDPIDPRQGADGGEVTSIRSMVTGVLRSIGVAGIGLLVGGGLTIGAGLALRLLSIELSITALVVLVLLLTQGVAFGGVAVGYLVLSGRGRSFVPIRLPTISDTVWMASGWLLALGAVIVAAVLASVGGIPTAENQIGQLALEEPGVLLWLVPFSFLLIGPGEELLFRGIVQGSLRETFAPLPAVVLASAIFAAIHVVALTGGASGRVVTIAILFLPSLVFGAAYERTNNLLVPIVIHGAYNATLFSILYFAIQTGAPDV